MNSGKTFIFSVLFKELKYVSEYRRQQSNFGRQGVTMPVAKKITCRKCDRSFEKQDFLRHKKGPCDLICTVCAEEFKVCLAVINKKSHGI